jgi:predicted DNA-binding protein (MmcQ/YjbR family)
MTLDMIRRICLALPDATEDVKWGQDLAFSVGGKMFCVVNADPPHQLSFKCTAEGFAELIERPGLRPAPYLARAMWVQMEELDEQLGGAFERGELERLIRQSYEVVRAKLPRRARSTRSTKARATSARRSRAVPRRAHRRKR